MSIILNEYDWAEQAIGSSDLGKKPSETIYRVAKYYMYCGYNKTQTRKKLDEFMSVCDPNAPISKWDKLLDGAVKNAAKYPLIILDNIPITAKEMETVDKLEGKQVKRLAFTLLCVAKFNIIAKGNSGGWVSTPDSDIMRMANINTSIKRQSAMFASLREAGLIRFSKKIDNLDVQVLFVDDSDAEPVLLITDYRNLGYQYLKFHGEPYSECQCCGLTIKQNTGVGRKQKYCPDCAVKIKIQQNINSVMRMREANE